MVVKMTVIDGALMKVGYSDHLYLTVIYMILVVISFTYSSFLAFSLR